VSAARGRAGRALAAVAVGLAVLGAARGAAAQYVAPEGSRFHNGSTLPLEDDGTGQQLLRRLQAALDRSEPDEAAAVMRALRADDRVLLLPFGPRVHMAALDLAARLVAQGGEGPVLQRVVEESRAAIAEARAARDLERLLDHATRGAALPCAAEAALDAARLEFERGAFWEAATLARRAAGRAGAAELEAAARRHLEPAATPSPPPPGSAAGFELQGASRLDFVIRGAVTREGDMLSLPAAASAGGGRLALLDDGGLSIVAREDGRPLIDPSRWLASQLARVHAGLGAPSPIRFHLVPDGDRLLLPFNTLTQRGFDDLWSLAVSAHLVAVDAASGEAAWTARFPANTWMSSACGPPVVVGPRVCTLVFRTTIDTEVSLACLSRDDGQRLFEVPLVAGTAVRRYASRLSVTQVDDVDKRAREGPPAERDGLVYACTGYGVVAVVDALTGWLRFTFRYDRLFSQELEEFDPAFLYDTGGWDEEPVRLWGDRVVVAPGDSRFLYVLASEPGPAGQLVLDDPIERLDRRYVAGLLPDPAGGASPAVLLTRRAAGDWGLELLGPGGRPLARTPPFDPPVFFSGRPLLLGSTVLVPSVVGLLAFRADDLSAAPTLLPRDASAPPVVSVVEPIAEGFVTFSPLIRSSGEPRPTAETAWIAQWYRSRP
jgi:hypothetical protein